MFVNSSWATGVVGHEKIVELLSRSMTRRAPGYLFTGVSHLGKRTIAERWIRAALELSDEQSLMAHPDLLVIEPDEGKTQISVEQIRNARERLSSHPMVAKQMIAYIPHADRMNDAGMNAMLKIVEEPPADAMFVFVAEHAGRIPETMKSRMIHLRFQRVSSTQIVEGLLSLGFSSSDATTRSSQCGGRPGFAIEPAAQDVGAQFLDEMRRSSSFGRRLGAVERLSKACDAIEDSTIAWTDAMESAMMLVWKSKRSLAERTILAASMASAWHAVHGAISPRIFLDAGSLHMSRSIPTPGFFDTIATIL